MNGVGDVDQWPTQWPSLQQKTFSEWGNLHGGTRPRINLSRCNHARNCQCGKWQILPGLGWLHSMDSQKWHQAILHPCSPADQSTYCSELFGLWGIMMALHRVTERWWLLKMLIIACSGKHKCLLLSTQMSPTTTLPVQSGLFTDTDCGYIITFEHVHGHQDLGIPIILSR